MKIIHSRRGQVGSSLAAELASEANDITVVDLDSVKLRALGDRLDIRTVQGAPHYRRYCARPVPMTPIC